MAYQNSNYPLTTITTDNDSTLNGGGGGGYTTDPSMDLPEVKRSDFPDDFVFGAATSAYQVEGGWDLGGKGLSNWDIFSQQDPKRIADNSNGNTAINQYHLFKEDVAFMKKLGLKSYRFSIAWTRILPGGRIYAGIAREGIRYYNELIDTLLAAGIEPCATLFHWDTPEALEKEYQGFLSDQIANAFGEFAEVCFWSFGDRVKRWITLNEPWSYTVQGYVLGNYPPARGATKSMSQRSADLVRHAHHRTRHGPHYPTTNGDPGREPYIVAHNLILAHARAVDIYRKLFQESQGGEIGMTNVSCYYVPLNDTSEADQQAASRANDFMIGWFVAPMVTGDYPMSMRKNVGRRLPEFTNEQKELVKGSYDFLGINYYTTQYASNQSPVPDERPSYFSDQNALPATERNGMPIGRQASVWLFVVPCGIYLLMKHLKDTYGDNDIYITENGVSEKTDRTLNVTHCLDDPIRIQYHKDHLFYLKKAMDEGVSVKGYYIWSLFDNYEWSEGYSVRFGIVFIHYENGRLTRFPKRSAIWWMNFLGRKPTYPPRKQLKERILEDQRQSVKRLRSS